MKLNQLTVLCGRNGSGKTETAALESDGWFWVDDRRGLNWVLPMAKTGTTYFLNQPECGRHPVKQLELADMIAKIVNRGVRVIVETHSEMLLLAIQTLVAKGELNDVMLHWFERNEDNSISITSTVMNSDGSYGDWPCDFGEVSLKAMKEYIDAAGPYHFKPTQPPKIYAFKTVTCKNIECNHKFSKAVFINELACCPKCGEGIILDKDNLEADAWFCRHCDMQFNPMRQSGTLCPDCGGVLQNHA